MSRNDSRPAPSHISRGITLVMAIATGVAVASIYYNQPLLEIMERGFPADRVVAFVPTATQLGYAAGLLLLVPLGDILNRRRLILIQFITLALALGLTALAPNGWMLIGTSIVMGLTASVAQQIVPFAAELADPAKRGQTIGTVMSGLLCGILFSRTIAGWVGEHYGWRAVFWLALVLVLATAALLAATLPHSRPHARHRYGELLGSLVHLWREEPALRRATLNQACLFGSFIAIWTVLSLQLDRQFHLGASIAGLFGIVGAVGVLVAPVAGRFADRRGPDAVITLGSIAMIAAWGLFAVWNSIAGLVTGVILIDFGEQGALISNQHIVFALRPEARNRVNTIFVGGMFLGGALGSAGASLAWEIGGEIAGWQAVCAFGAVLAVLALAILALGRIRKGAA